MAELDERRSTVGIPQVEVPLVGHRRLATKGEVGMGLGRSRRVLVDPAPPDVHPFLRLAHQHHPRTILSGGGQLIGTDDLLFGVATPEPHHREVTIGDEAIQVADHPIVVVAQQRRRRDVAPADLSRSVQQELDQTPFVLQGRDIAGHTDTVHRPHPKRDVCGQ